jgi:two-component system chemotaxis response regulator CheB
MDAPIHGTSRPEIRRVVGITASAGGIDALRVVVRELPPDLPAAVLVVLHIRAHGQSRLAMILDRETPLHVATAVDGEPLVADRVYVAPPDRHLRVHADRVELDAGPPENGVRPAADAMLRSLAEAHGPRAVAVILSGALADGAAGAACVGRAGGVVVVQDPQDAIVPGMPRSAIAAVPPDRIAPASAIGSILAELVRRSPAASARVAEA